MFLLPQIHLVYIRIGGVGGALHVERDRLSVPVKFYYRQLHGAEYRYLATELEALAVK